MYGSNIAEFFISWLPNSYPIPTTPTFCFQLITMSLRAALGQINFVITDLSSWSSPLFEHLRTFLRHSVRLRPSSRSPQHTDDTQGPRIANCRLTQRHRFFSPPPPSFELAVSRVITANKLVVCSREKKQNKTHQISDALYYGNAQPATVHLATPIDCLADNEFLSPPSPSPFIFTDKINKSLNRYDAKPFLFAV